MKAQDHLSRRLSLLSRIARCANGRRYKSVPLSDVGYVNPHFTPSPGTVMGALNGDDSDMAYDLETLEADEFINIMYTVSEGSPTVMITPAGIEAVLEHEKTWWQKAIDKQPMTFLQVLLALVSIALSVIGGAISGWFAGRAATPTVEQVSTGR